MSLKKAIVLLLAFWVVTITAAHAWLNWNLRPFSHDTARVTQEKYKLGYLPVTCHLTCPVTDYINHQMNGEGLFTPVRFNGWPELKEAHLSGYTPATFILAPMAIALREQGVKIKIVYLGHRDGTAMMVHRSSQIYRIEDLRGKTIAVPNRYSNQRLLIFRALREHGMTIDDVHLVEMPPPDMPTALSVKAVDAITSGEPYMGQTELDGYGRVLYLTKDIWPNFISCVLAVNDDMITHHRDAVQQLVNGIARSGKWLDQSMDHRMEASQFVAQDYFHQDPKLLRFVLSKPPDRVKYTNLTLHRKDFEEIERLGKESGILQGVAHFDDYADTSFVQDEAQVKPWEWETKK